MSIELLEKINTLNPPEFRINGIPITWNHVINIVPSPGANPTIYEILTDDDSAEKIWESALNEPTAESFLPTVDITYRFEERNKVYEGTLYKFCVLERQYSDRFMTLLLLGDVRIRGFHKMQGGSYNFRRQQANSQIAQGAAPHPVFEDRWVFPTDNYLKWSLKDNRPYKAIELIDEILRRVYGSNFGGYIKFTENSTNKFKDVSGVDWTDVAPDNIVLENQSIMQALDSLLLLARSSMNVFHNLDGKIYVYELAEDFDIREYLPEKKHIEAGSGLIYRRDKRRYAPEKYKIYFKSLYEIPLMFDYEELSSNNSEVLEKLYDDWVLKTGYQVIESSASSLGRGIIKYLEPKDPSTTTAESQYFPNLEEIPFNINKSNLWNVAPLPFGLKCTMKGKEIYFPTGTYVPIKLLINELKYVDEKLILKHWYENSWIVVFLAIRSHLKGESMDGIRRFDRRSMMLLSAILENFWTTFMIHPNLRASLNEIDFTRTEMENYEYNYRQPAPLWLSYIDAPTSKFMIKNEEVKPACIGENIPDLKVHEIMKLEQAPFMAEVVDKELGIFKVMPTEDLKNIHYSFEKGIIKAENLPNVNPELNKQGWGKSPKEPKFRLVTLITASLAVPNSIHKNHSVDIDPVNKGENGHKEFMSEFEAARFSWDESMSDLDDIKKVPRNLDDLKIVAQAETNVLEYQYMPWWVGRMIYSGIYLNLFSRSNLMVGYHFSESECSTSISADVPPPPQSIYSEMDSDDRRRIARELPLGLGGQ